MNALPPEILEQRVVCSISAAVKFQVPANIVLAVAEIENGRPGRRSQNTNGTEDVGTMQFNTSYLSTLNKYGINASDVAKNNCYPFDLAAWRLAGHIANDTGDIWTKSSNYHSRTSSYNAIYRRKLITKAAKWELWLVKNFNVELK